MVGILPFIDRRDLYDRWDFNLRHSNGTVGDKEDNNLTRRSGVMWREVIHRSKGDFKAEQNQSLSLKEIQRGIAAAPLAADRWIVRGIRLRTSCRIAVAASCRESLTHCGQFRSMEWSRAEFLKLGP